MQAFLFLAAAFGWAVCQESLISASDTSYSVGKEYVYRYETQAMSGFPKGGQIWSGLRMSCQVLVQVSEANKLRVQLTSRQVSKLNDQVDAADPRQELLPSELFQELSDADTELMKQDLCKPVTVTYMRGHVEELVTEVDDPTYSVDIKRGLISLLEVNFNERQSLDSDKPVIRDDGKPVIYRVIEPSVSGDCETTYKLTHNRSLDNTVGMTIQKVRHLDRCIDTVVTSSGILDDKPCKECPCKECEARQPKEALRPSSSVMYTLLGSPDRFVIISASSEAKYIAAPYPDQSASPATYTRQSLSLTVSRPITIQIRELQSPRQHDRPLKGQGSSMRKASGHNELSPQDRDALVQKGRKLVQGLEKLIRDGVKDGAGDVQLELYTVLWQLDRTGIESLVDQTQSSMSRKALMDLLSSAGTYGSVDYLLDGIYSGKLDSMSATFVLTSVAHFPKPDVSVVSRILDFIKSKDQKLKTDSPVLRRAAWLCLGALGHKLVQTSAEMAKDYSAREKIANSMRSEANDKELRKKLDQQLEDIGNRKKQLQEQYDTQVLEIQKMVKQLLSQEDSDSQRLALKVAGSLGYESLLEMLSEIIQDRSQDHLKRLLAITSMEKIASVAPSKVSKLLMGLFHDRTEADDVRIIAYLTLLAAKPNQSDLELVARSLEDEPSVNVGSLVYTSLQELSKTSTSCMENRSKNSSMAMRYAKTMDSQEQRSMFMLQSMYDKDVGVGMLYQQVIVGMPGESFPRATSFKVSPALLARNSDLLEVGMFSKGVDSLYEDILGSIADSELQAFVHTFLYPRYRRSTSPSEQRVADIKRKVGVKPVERAKPEGHVYVKMYGQEVLYLDMESIASVTAMGQQQGKGKPDALSILKSLKEDMGILASLKNLQSQTSFAMSLVQLGVTTECGLPLRADLYKQGIVQVHGSFHIQQDPRQTRSSSFIGKMDAVVDIKPSLFFEARPRMGVQMKHITSGLELPMSVSVDIPVSAVINVDPEKTKLLISFKDQKPVRVAKLEERMFTVISMDPSQSSEFAAVTDRKEITAVEGADINMISLTVGDIFGRRSTLEGEIRCRKDMYSPLLLYSGRQYLQVKYQPQSQSDFVVQLQHIRDAASSSEDEEDSSSSGGWFSSVYSWLYSGDRSSSSKPDRESQASDSSEDEFLDLAEKDLSIDYLMRKFEKDTPMYSSGPKCGLVLRIADAGPQPQYETQLSTLYQREPAGQISYTLQLKQAQRIAKKQPWRIVADMKLDVPNQDIRPSDLFSSEYQKQIHDMIKVSITEDGKQVDSLLDLISESKREASEEVRQQTKSTRLDSIIEKAVSNSMLRSTDTQLPRCIQQQRKLEKEIRSLNEKSLAALSVKKDLKSLRAVIDKSVKNLEAVGKRIDSTKPDEQGAEDSVQVLYVIAKQRKFLWVIDRISEKLQSLISIQEAKDLASHIQDLQRKVDEVQDKQRQRSAIKSDKERVSVTALSTEEKNLYDSVQNIDRQLASLSVVQTQRKQLTDEDGEKSKAIVSDIIKNAAQVRDDIDKKMLQDPQIDKLVSTRITEVLLKMKITAEDIDKQIEDFNKKIAVRDMTRSRVDTDKEDRLDLTKKTLSKQKEEVCKVAKQLAERLQISIWEESERKSFSSELRSEDQASVRSLIKQTVQQLKSLEWLEERRESLGGKQDISSDQFKQVIQDAKKSKDELNSIWEKEWRKIETEKRTDLFPVVIRTVKLVGRLSEIVSNIKQVINQEVKELAVKGDADIQAYEAMKNDVENTQSDLQAMLNSVDNVLRKSRKWSDDAERQNSMFVLERSDMPSRGRLEPGCSRSAILKQALKVESRQLRVKSALASVLEMLSQDKATQQFSPAQDRASQQVSSSSKDMASQDKASQQISSSHDKASRQVRMKQLIYDVISQLQTAQDDLDSIHAAVIKTSDPRCRLSDSVTSDRTFPRISDIQARQISLVESLEEGLQQTSSYSHIVQQLRDRILRQKHDMKSLQDSMKAAQSSVQADSRRQLSEDRSSSRDDTEGASQSRSRAAERSTSYHREMTGAVKIRYGDENTSDKHVKIQVIARKSLEQLLWESNQRLPGQQDPQVSRYLADRQRPDDIASPYYEPLRVKLNTLRHLHILAAYEDGVSEMVREFAWKTQGLVKLVFYDRVTISMPDESNTHNMVQVVAELRLDNKHMDAEIKSPYETNLIRAIRIPQVGSSGSISMADAFISAMASDPRSVAVCLVTPDRVRQLTGQTIQAELRSPDCETVLAMDCSRRNTLAVTSRPAPGEASKQIVTIVTQDRTIEIVPDSVSVAVRVDGAPIARQPYPEVTRVNGDGKRSVSVRQLSDGRRVEVILQHRQASIVSDGTSVSIKVARVQLPTLCGVCGSVRSLSGLVGPEHVEYSDPDAFLSSYLVHSDRCDAATIQTQLGVHDRIQESKLVHPDQRTDVKHMIQNGIPKTCFSIQPIKECPSNTRAEKTESIMVPYFCVRSSSPMTEKFLEITRRRVLDEVRDKTASSNENQIRPQICIAN